jgi:proton glutamate symport protein
MLRNALLAFKRINLTSWIFIAMALGVLVGCLAPSFSVQYLGLLASAVFLPMIKACIVPLVFSTLVVGIAGHGDDIARVGRLAWKSILYFVLLTFVALAIGLSIVNMVNPGIGISLDGLEQTHNPDTGNISLKDELNKIFQPSFFQAAVGFSPSGKPTNSGGEILAIVFMSVIFSIAIMKCEAKESKSVMLAFNDSLSQIMFSVVNIVMLFAPWGIFGAMAATIGHSGVGILVSLGKLIGCLYLGLVVFVFLVLAPVLWATRVPFVGFLRQITEPLLIAFSTASSDAALPKAMENMIEFGVPKHVVAFVLPTGYTFNLDGTTLYLAVASVFAAQASGVSLSIGQQIYMMLVLMISSKGVAAVPRASLVVLAATIDQFGLNSAAIGLILGVDNIMDMARTSVNVIGNCVASVVVSRWEGNFGQVDSETEYDAEHAAEKHNL